MFFSFLKLVYSPNAGLYNGVVRYNPYRIYDYTNTDIETTSS